MTLSPPLDDLDRTLLSQLGADARISVATLARRLKLARSTVQSRIERLERTGIIAGYTLRLGEAARAGIRATVLLSIEPQTQPAVLARLRALPEVERIVTTSGRVDLMVQIEAGSTGALDQTLDAIGATPGVRSSESLVHLSLKLDRTG